jgi:hypothetical protein
MGVLSSGGKFLSKFAKAAAIRKFMKSKKEPDVIDEEISLVQDDADDNDLDEEIKFVKEEGEDESSEEHERLKKQLEELIHPHKKLERSIPIEQLKKLRGK